MKKRLIVLLMAAVLLASAAVGVSADYVTMLDYGLGYYSRVNALRWLNGAGSTATNATKFVVYWALDSFDSDYTYTFTFNFSSDADINFSPKYVTGSSEGRVFLDSFLIGPYYNFDNADDLDVYSSFEKVDDKYVLTVKLNPGLLNWTKFPMYVYLYYNLQSETTFTTNGWGVSAEYDPGGSKYIEDYLSDIRDQLHAGDDYTPPTSAATDLNNSLTSLDSVEASLSSKAEELRTAGSATMSSAISAAQELPNKIGASTTFLATTFTRFWEAVPEEVTAVLLVCAAILFAGWLIGRIQ